MSRKKGTKVPISGTLVPENQHIALDEAAYTKMVAAALQKHFRHAHGGTKTVMGWTGASERAVKNWFGGTKGPNGEHLIILAGRSDAVFDGLLRLAGRKRYLLGNELSQTRGRVVRVLALLDGAIASQAFPAPGESQRTPPA